MHQDSCKQIKFCPNSSWQAPLRGAQKLPPKSTGQQGKENRTELKKGCFNKAHGFA